MIPRWLADSVYIGCVESPEFPHELLQVLDTFFDHNDDPAFEAASENVYNSFRRAFYLHHPTYHIGYEDFDMSDLRDHSVLTVRACLESFQGRVSNGSWWTVRIQ
jgi:hypothetical protein